MISGTIIDTTGTSIVTGLLTINHFGTAGNDVMRGSSYFRNRFHGSAGQDVIIGSASQIDTVDYSASAGRVVVDLTGVGQSGDAAGDTYSSIENAVGSAYDDRLRGNSVDNTLDGGAGNDDLYGGFGNDTLKGGNGKDTLYGEAGADKLYGGNGSDTLYADLDDLVLDGGSGDAGLDTLSFRYVSQGLNIVFSGDGAGTASGGGRSVSFAGIERIEGTGTGDTITADGGYNFLRGGDGNDTLSGLGGVDELFGDEGVDTLFGGSEGDTLYGGSGNDSLFGEGGNDKLFGDSYSDRLNGGRGDDELMGDTPGVEILAGGQGSTTPPPGIFFADIFVFDNSEDDDDRDIIWDFAPGVDRIDLSATERFGDEQFDDELLDYSDQVGNDVVIDMGDGTLTLKGVDIDDLSASDFIF